MARTFPPSPNTLIQAKIMVAMDQACKKKVKRIKDAKTETKGASKMHAKTVRRQPISTPSFQTLAKLLRGGRESLRAG